MTRTRVVLQARASSRRLPAKALLPVAGIPSAVLAALRAGRNGMDVVVATSVNASDDVLAGVMEGAGIRVVRGSLEDVLARFEAAAADLPDDAVVVRLTGDNVFPDADFVERLVNALDRGGHGYLGTRSPYDDLPYGLSAEAFRTRLLREAADRATTEADREHVTPWIRRRFGGAAFRPPEAPPGLGRLRCTIDSLADYQRVVRVFRSVEDPVRISWLDLCRRLDREPDAPAYRVPFGEVDGAPHGTFVLGTAQLGMRYGRTNAAGQPPSAEAVEIVRTAIDHGVTHVDTARIYGESERRLGIALRDGWSGRAAVVTKLDPGIAGKSAEGWALAAGVDASVFRSCRELEMPRLPVVLLHDARQRTRAGGRIWDRLKELREEGVVGRLGVSVQRVQEARAAFDDPDVRHVQLPLNVLDRRWTAAGIDRLAAGRPDVVVHARSALLQGVLASDDLSPWPRVGGYDPAAVVGALRRLAEEMERDGPADLCLAFVRAQQWVHGTVVGVASREQLLRNLHHFTRPVLGPDDCARVEETFSDLPPALLNPACWP